MRVLSELRVRISCLYDQAIAAISKNKVIDTAKPIVVKVEEANS